MSAAAHHAGGARMAAPHRRKAPLLSILIVVFRDRAELVGIVQSILPFRNDDLEILVVDGFSQDGTVEELGRFGEQIDYWISEPDSGIYDAMNKGLRAAAGTYILHLNAGDRLLHVPWQELRQCAADLIDVVCCRVLLDNNVEFVSKTGMLSKIDNTWHHQGTFYRRSAHLGYDTSYRGWADFHHNQRLLRAHCSLRQLSTLVASHAGNGVTACTSSHEEIYRSVRDNYGWWYHQLARIRFALRDGRDRFIKR